VSTYTGTTTSLTTMYGISKAGLKAPVVETVCTEVTETTSNPAEGLDWSFSSTILLPAARVLALAV